MYFVFKAHESSILYQVMKKVCTALEAIIRVLWDSSQPKLRQIIFAIYLLPFALPFVFCAIIQITICICQ
jgi:hypothetical protein